MQNTFKLVSPKETLLGTVTVPGYWAYQLLGGDRPDTAWPAVEFNYMPEERRRRMFFAPGPDEPLATFQRCAIVYRRWTRFGPAVVLYGITPEEFETIEGCSFAPGAGYLRSLMEAR